MTRHAIRRPHLLLIAALAAAPVMSAVPTVAAASSEPPDAAARVDDGLTALETVLADAGFVAGDGRGEIDDPLGLTDEDEDTPFATCLPAGEGVVADDGAFVGQVAGSTAAIHHFADSGTLPSDPSEKYDLPTVRAAVAVVEPDVADTVRGVFEQLASDELQECVDEAIATWLAERQEETDDSQSFGSIEGSVTVESLGIGDASFRLDIVQSGTDEDGTEYSVTATAAGAVVDDVVITFTVSAYDVGGGSDVPDVVVDAVEAAADAAG